MGGLPMGITQDEFFDGASRPRNPGIMRIFRDIELVEQLGTGLKKLTNAYGREAYSFYRDHIVVTLPFNKEVMSIQKVEGGLNGGLNGGLSKSAHIVYEAIAKNSYTKIDEIAMSLQMTNRTIERAIKELKDRELIHRVGSKKIGFWEIIE
jgi:predicted HTH transcriptional regulator